MIITIGRQLGSGGREVGKRLAEEMGLAYYDKELLEYTAQESGLSRNLFEGADEKTGNVVPAGFFGMRIPFLGDAAIHTGGLSNEMLFKIQSDVMRQLADKQPSIFIGRCADYILRDRKDCLNVFISANDEDRIRRIIDFEGISVEKAREKMERIDKKRSAFYNFYSNKTWGMAASYHACLNTSVLGIDRTVSLIKKMAEAFE